MKSPLFLARCRCTWWHAVQANLGSRCLACGVPMRRATDKERRLYDRQMKARLS